MKTISTYSLSTSVEVNDDGTLDKGIFLTVYTPKGKEPIRGRLDYEGFRKYITLIFEKGDARITREEHAQAQFRHFEQKEPEGVK